MSFTSPLAGCEYLPDRLSQIRYEVAPQLQPLDYLPRLEAGWRRFGPAMFRPECPSCAMCQSLRVPVATFRANESQRRAWKKNQGTLAVRIGSPVISRERLDLWERFHQHGHHSKGWPEDIGNGPGIMLLNPFPTEEWTYYVEDRLVGVGYVDILPGALSAIYFYWDPDESARSLGTFHVLSTIAAARERELAHVYLGYYVEGCRSLEYKARFRPNEVLRGNNRWEPFVTGASPPTEVGHTVPERR